MDQLEEKQHRTSRGITYRYYISPKSGKDASKPTLLMLHGFPDAAMLWCKVVPHLQGLPNRLLIPDLLGYGGTDKPTDPKLYAFDAMSRDMADILDAEGIDTVISLGHDWGSALAQRFYNFHASRVSALVMFEVDYIVPDKSGAPHDPQGVDQETKKILGHPLAAYEEFFISPDAPEVCANNLDRFWEAVHTTTLLEMLCLPGAMRDYILDTERPHRLQRAYAEDQKLKESWKSMISAGGFAAPFCWYRASTEGVQAECERRVPDDSIVLRVPTLYVGCMWDGMSRLDEIKKMGEAGLLLDLKTQMLESGHWCPYEKPVDVAECIETFLKDKDL